MKKFLALQVFVWFSLASVRAQIVNEVTYPSLPQRLSSLSITPGHNGFYLSGLSTTTSFSPLDDIESFGSSVFFFVLHPESSQRSVITLPDTGSFWSGGLFETRDEFAVTSAVSNDDSMFVAWSKMNVSTSDVPGATFELPTASAGKIVGGAVQKFLSMENGLNPCIVVDGNRSLHCVWERVSPIVYFQRPDFAQYGSTILYIRRDPNGTLSDTLVVGKGFLPRLVLASNSLYCIYIQGDSTSQPSVSLVCEKITGDGIESPVQLYAIPLPFTYTMAFTPPQNPLYQFDCGADTLGGIHCGWRSPYSPEKIFVAHCSTSNQVQVDSTSQFYSATANFRFMPDGEARAFACAEASYGDTAVLHYYSSRQGSSLLEKQTVSLGSPYSSMNTLLVDSAGNQDAVILNGSYPNTSSILRYIGTDSVSTVYLATGYYNIGQASYVDKSGRVWLTAQRDSTSLMLNFSLSDLGKAKDFEFPLTPGTVWYYRVVNIEDFNSILQSYYYDSTVVSKDTMFSNGVVYAQFFSKQFGSQFFRRDGFRVFQYSPTDSTERLRFDLSAHKGDTIGVYSTTHYVNSVVLRDTGSSFLFGLSRRTETFQGVLPGSTIYQATVADSLGIVDETDGLAFEEELVGAKINGVVYGTVVGVRPSPQAVPLRFSLSQNFPNPFNPATTIRFTTGETAPVTLKVFDLLGREVAVLVNEKKNAGTYTVRWNATAFASGVYFCRLQAGAHVDTKKMILLK